VTGTKARAYSSRLRVSRVGATLRGIKAASRVREGEAGTDGEVVRATPLADVGRESSRPSLVVESAVLANRLRAVIENVGVEELASLVEAALRRVSTVVGRLGGAGSGAERDVEGARGELKAISGRVSECLR